MAAEFTNPILQQAKAFSKLCNGIQSEYYHQQLKDFKKVEVISLYEVFSEEEIKIIKKLPLRKKECFRNSALLVTLFPDKVKYTEGQVAILNNSFGIDHAWNEVEVDGKKKYIDVTFELVLKESINKDDLYMMLGVYNIVQLTDVLLNTGVYGGIYDYYFRKKETNENENKNKRV